MKKLTCQIFRLLILIFISQPIIAADLIPIPLSYRANGEEFVLNDQTRILYTSGLEKQASLLAAALSPATGWDFELSKSKKTSSNSIFLSLGKTGHDEGYELNSTAQGIEIKGQASAGVFYGIQTLLQLLPSDIYNKKRQKGTEWKVEGVEIKDAPDYKWRGMMLDVSRYFFEKDYVLRYIDMMAMYKLNVLHMHLIDDAGWRLEIKKYPRLTSVGAWRGEGPERTGGFYTQDDIREIVSYATDRNVDVIPEIEIPAHTLAAVAAYPFLSCREEQVKVPTHHFISRDLYCVGKESTFDFLRDVFEEAFALFPSKYIHIGGDEAKYDRWKKCPHCQKRKEDLGLKSEAELQVYFNQRIQNMVKEYGKTIVGWDEIIEEGLEQKAVGMVWHDKKKALMATKQGHDVVMALTDHCYFDVAESNIPGEIKAATWLKPISLEQAYLFNPMIEGLDEKYREQILGGEATMWSDQFIHGTILQELPSINENRSEKYFDYLTFPRMSALAEALWSPRSKQNWTSFEGRMRTHYNRYDEAGYGYRLPQPKLISKKEAEGGIVIELENVVKGAELRYTTDGTWANVHSQVYSDPITVKRLQDFQVITVMNRHQYSLPLLFPENYDQFKSYGKLLAEWRPKDLDENMETYLDLDATGKVNKNGIYQLAFLKTDGQDDMKMHGIEVYKNGRKIAEDNHSGVAKSNSDSNMYKFEINDYETGASFTVKAKVSGSGVDSFGVVFLGQNKK